VKHKLLIVFIFFTAFLQACSVQNEEAGITAVDGQMDLTIWNIEESMIRLDGEWEFYWNQLIHPTEFHNGSAINHTGVIELPSRWHTYTLQGKPLPKKGYATFRLHVSMPEINGVLGLRVPEMRSNYNLWIDDKLIAKNGQVGTNKLTSVPQKYPQIVYFSPKSNTFDVTLQISNYHYKTGGMTEPIQLGTSEMLHKKNLGKTILQSIMLGILILSGVYHIGLGFFRKTESYFFFFGVFCLIVAFRYLMIGDVYFTKMFPNFNWELAMKLDYISLYCHVPLLALVLYRLYPKYSSQWFTKLCIFISVVYVLMTIITKASFYTSVLVYFQLFMIICLLYTTMILLKSLKNKQVESYFLLTGIILFMVFVLFDIVVYWLNYPEVNLYPVGIAVFILCFSLLVSNRFSTSLDLTKQLAEDLSILNQELEAKVEQRTEQIQQSNKKLEELNDQLKKMALMDGLTNIPNRRYFEEYFEEKLAECMEKSMPISVLLLDIDYFKLYNDFYGHQQGDTCLKEVAQTLNKLEDGLAARYGGEEFVCVLPNANETSAELIALELNQEIQQLKIPHEKSLVSPYVSVSIGVTTIIPSETTHKKVILEEADSALYQAKSSGRNKVINYRRKMTD
jgi:diguanylate cyclase (GGDEF)-like protein